MNREHWLAERQRGLGGSDAAAALGLSKWKTPYQLFLEKRGEAPPVEETEPMRWGRALEPVVIQRYADDTQSQIETFAHKAIWHPTLKFMFVTPDGINRTRQRYVEAKTARTKEGWGEPGSDQIPQEYVVQVQHAMIVLALEVTDVPVLFGGSEFAIYELAADHELQDMVRDGEADFWKRVVRGDPPDPITLDDANRRWGRRAVPNGVQANAMLLEACARLNALKAERERVNLQCEQLEVLIKSGLADSEALLYGKNVLCTWKLTKARESFDKEGLRAMHPDLYQQFIKPGDPYRRFLLKGPQ